MQAIKKIYLSILTIIVLLAPHVAYGMNSNSSTSLTHEHIDWLKSLNTVIQTMPPDVKNVIISPDNQYLAIYCGENYQSRSIQLFTTDDFSPIKDRVFEKVFFCEFRADSKQFLIRYSDSSSSVQLYHTHNTEPVNHPTFKNVSKVDFSPDNQHLAMTTLEQSRTTQLYNLTSDEVTPNSTFDNVSDFLFSPKGNYLLIKKRDGAIGLFNIHNKKLIIINVAPWTYRFSPNDNYLAIKDNNDLVKLFHIDNFSFVDNGTFTDVYDYKFSPNSKRLAITYRNKQMQLFNLKDLSHIDNNNIFRDKYYSEAFSPDRKNHVAFSPDSKYLIMRDLRSINFLHNYHLSPIDKDILKDIESYDFSPDGKYIVITKQDYSRQLLNTEDFSPTHLHIPKTGLYQFSHDSSYILIKQTTPCSNETTLNLYILDPQKELLNANQKGLNLIDKLFKNRQNNNTTLTDDEQKSYNLLPTALKMALCKYISIKNS